MPVSADILAAWMEMEQVLELLPLDDPDRHKVRRAADALDSGYCDLIGAGADSHELLILAAQAMERSAALLATIRGRVTDVSRDTLDALDAVLGTDIRT